MFTIMQLSDLHRSKGAHISNDVLLSSLLADYERLSMENPTISKPNAIIVSGDLVQGVPISDTGYPETLEKQFKEALEFLTKLSNDYLGGDRSKIIIIPGNHDIDWNTALLAMEPISTSNTDIPKLLALPNSKFRWSWKDQKLYSIMDQKVYADRLKYFYNLYTSFYDDVLLTFPLQPSRPWNLFELDDGKIVVCAFNSCVNNDCFNNSGVIPAEAISQSHLKLLNHGKTYLLKVALWHHDVMGSPNRSDYIDIDSVRLMIDRGYRLGLHGHQHKSDASPYFLHTYEEQSMSILSAGSLCAGAKELPGNVRRQYNIIEISDDYMHARVHVREMNVPGVFSQGRLIALGGRSFKDIKWSVVPPDNLVNTSRGGGSITAISDQIDKLLAVSDFSAVITIIESTGHKLGQYGRQVLSKALFKTKEWGKLVKHLSDPQSSDELAMVIQASIARKDWPRAEEFLSTAEESKKFPENLMADLKGQVKAEKEISK